MTVQDTSGCPPGWKPQNEASEQNGLSIHSFGFRGANRRDKSCCRNRNMSCCEHGLTVYLSGLIHCSCIFYMLLLVETVGNRDMIFVVIDSCDYSWVLFQVAVSANFLKWKHPQAKLGDWKQLMSWSVCFRCLIVVC